MLFEVNGKTSLDINGVCSNLQISGLIPNSGKVSDMRD